MFICFSDTIRPLRAPPSLGVHMALPARLRIGGRMVSLKPVSYGTAP